MKDGISAFDMMTVSVALPEHDEVSESTLNDVLCADCGAKMMEHEGIIKSETVFLDIVYEGEPICEPCLDARCLTARENVST